VTTTITDDHTVIVHVVIADLQNRSTQCRGGIDGLVMARKGISDRADGRERSEIRPENFCGSEDRGSHCHGRCGNRQKRSN
jgi:hypothetical protein